MRSALVLLLLACSVWCYCPSNSVHSPSRGECFTYFEFKLDFLQAEDFCRTLGGHLASIQNAFENAVIGDDAQKQAGPTSSQFWIGGAKLNTNEFQWQDGSQFSYTKWDKNQPNYTNECVSVSPSNSMWGTSNCQSALPFVCGSPYDPLRCEEGWIWKGEFNSCYKVIYQFNSWSNAELHCQSLEAHLASMHSDAENSFVSDYARQSQTAEVDDKQQVWIGMSKNSQGNFIWNDGTQANYSNWAPGQPDNWEGNENCVQLYADMKEKKHYRSNWNDIRCDSPMRAAVCKKGPLN